MLHAKVRRLLVLQGQRPGRNSLAIRPRARADARRARRAATLHGRRDSGGGRSRNRGPILGAGRRRAGRVEDGVVTLEGAISEDSLRGGLKVLVENSPA